MTVNERNIEDISIHSSETSFEIVASKKKSVGKLTESPKLPILNADSNPDIVLDANPIVNSKYLIFK